MLDYMYEGYGYDMDNQLLYTDVEKYDEALDSDGYSDNGMKTFASKDLGIIGHDDALEVEKANEYKKEVIQFVSENGANYTDLRQGVCACGGQCVTTSWPYDKDASKTIEMQKPKQQSGNTSGNTASGSTSGSTTTSGDTVSGSTSGNTSGSTSGNTTASGDTASGTTTSEESGTTSGGN